MKSLESPSPLAALAGRFGRRATLLACGWALASCLVSGPALTPEATAAPRIAAERTRGQPIVVLLALDGVRWQEVFGGVDRALARRFRLMPSEVVGATELMPSTHALLQRSGAAIGAPEVGEEMVASGPNFVSLPGYLELFRGRRDSRCTDNACLPVAERTVVDEISALSQGFATEVAVISSWPGVLRAAARHPERIVASTGRTGGPTRHYLRRDPISAAVLSAGEASGSYPGHGDYRPDPYTAALALRFLETEHPRLLFIGLGDTDAYAHKGLYREYLRALGRADAVIGDLDRALERLRAQGHRATLLVTTDHGRGRRFAGHGAIAPESARIWLLAAGSGIRARGLVAAPELRRLSDVAPTVRRLLAVPPPEHPTHAAGQLLVELF